MVRLGIRAEMVQKLFNRTTGEVAAESKAVMVATAPKTGRAFPFHALAATDFAF